MRFVIFGDDRQLGLIDEDRVLNLARAARAYGEAKGAAMSAHENAFSSLSGLIETGRPGLTIVQEALEKLRGSDQPGLFSKLSDVRLHAPWPGQRLVMAGVNFGDHVANFFTHFGVPMTEEEAVAKVRSGSPQGFWAVARPMMGPDCEIEIPARANGLFDYEIEPGLVFGKRGKDIKSRDFADHIWGVTLLADWSVRDETFPPKPSDSFLFSKNFDCSKSVGPCIVVDEVEPDDLVLQTLVNDIVKQDFNSKDMIFSFAEVVEYLSTDFTFHPGDVVGGGTAAGTAVDQVVPSADGTWPRDLFLKPGDIVEMRSPQIGSFTSKIVEKRHAPLQP